MRHRRIAGLWCAVLLAAASGTAVAAGPGETFAVGGLTLAPGALPGSDSGDAKFGAPALSADGRYVAFASRIDALDAGDDDDTIQTYRKDRTTGEVVLISRATGAAGAPGGGDSTNPAISASGARVAFLTTAGLDPADADGRLDVYVRDLDTMTTRLLTPGTNDPIRRFDLSANGEWVVFTSSTPLGPGDVNGIGDVYRVRVADGAMALVSQINGPIAQAANDESYSPDISPDGRYVAYSSEATDLVAGFVDNSPFAPDVYLRDMTPDDPFVHTRLVTTRWDSAQNSANGRSDDARIAAKDGSLYVVFTSQATDVVDNATTDASVANSVYRRRMIPAGPPVLVSRADGPAGANAADDVFAPAVSDDGRLIAFTSNAANLSPGSVGPNVHVRDMLLNTTRRVSANAGIEFDGTISGDGSVVAWSGTGPIHPDLDPVFGGVFARSHTVGAPLGPVELVSRPQGTAPLRQAHLLTAITPGARTISSDGRYVLLTGIAPTLPGSTVTIAQVYRRDTLTGEIVLVSRASGADGAAGSLSPEAATMSADGNRVAFISRSPNLDPAANGATAQVFLRDIAAGTTRLVSRSDGVAGAPSSSGTPPSATVAISADGDTVLFPSDSVNLGAPGGTEHLYARRVGSDTTLVVDRTDGLAGAVGTLPVTGGFAVSGDGSRAVFATQSSNFGFPLGPVRVYVRDLTTGTTRLVSRESGELGAAATESSQNPTISGDGRIVAFTSTADELAPEAGVWPGGTQQVVVRDLTSHQNRLASRAPGAGAPAGRSADWPSLNADGSVVAFETQATNLLPGRGGDGRGAVLVRLMTTGDLVGPPALRSRRRLGQGRRRDRRVDQRQRGVPVVPRRRAHRLGPR